MKKIILKLNAIILIIQLLIFPFSLSLVEAEELPSKEQLTTEIQQQAQTEFQQSTNPQPQPSSEPAQQTEVTNTGDDVTVHDEQATSEETQVANTNAAEVNQTVDATANTGGNEASRNISFGGNAGVIVTGNAAAAVNTQAQVNTNQTAVSSGYPSGNNATTIGNTGNNLTSSSSQSHNKLTMVNNKNTAIINQVTNTQATTGNNKAERNIAIGGGQAGVILTGNAYTDVDYLVAANGNVALIGGESTGNGPGSGASIVLLNTGNNPFIASRYGYNRYTAVDNQNTASITQQCAPLCMANTGGNTANGNIGMNGSAGIIRTGNAYLLVALDAQANGNHTAISGGGNGTDKQSVDVVNTGDNAHVSADSESNSETNVNNKNYARVNQVISAIANTGNNTANRNISFGGDAGVILTGDAVVVAETSAKLNTNETTIGGSSSTAQLPPETRDGCPASNTTSIVNTGDDLTVDTSAQTNQQIQVANTNKAAVRQEVNGSANTGKNTSNRNIGESTGIIETGDAALGVGLQAHMNKNTTVITDCVTLAQAQPTPTVTPTKKLTPSPTHTPSPTSIVTPTSTLSPTPTTMTTTTSTSNGGNNGGFKGGVPMSQNQGSVLGASVSRLPQTGPEDTLMILLTAAIMLLSGDYMRRYNNQFASSSYKLHTNRKGV